MIGNESITGSVGETENLKGSLTNANSLDGSVNNSGTLIQAYTLPVASANTLGGIKVGANLSIEEDGTLNATASASGGSVEFKGLPTYAETGSATFDFTKKEIGVYSYSNLTSVYLPNGNLFTPSVKSTTLYYVKDYKEVTQKTIIAYLESDIQITSKQIKRVRVDFEYNPATNSVTSLSNTSDILDIPTKTSQLTNDSNFLTSIPTEYITEAELSEKGYLTEHQDISNLATKDELHTHSNKSVLDNISQASINNWDAKSNFSGSYNDLTNKPTIPTKVSQLSNDSSYASESYVTNAIANAQLGGGDTEIDLSGYATKDDLANKVDKVTGKSLIADSEISRLAGLKNYDDTEIKNTLKTKADTSAIPTKVSQLSNDKGYLTGVPTEYVTESELNAKGYLTSVPSEYITETELNNKGYLTEHQDISNLATKNELHSHSNKTILDGITQTNITNWNNKSNFSGSYNDLTNKPTIPTVPTKVSAFTNDAGYLTSIPSEYVTESELNDAISNLGGGTGNVSSSVINSIEVVDELPETEIEGVLYLVKEQEDAPIEEVNLIPNLVAYNATSNGVTFSCTGNDTNLTLNGTASSSEERPLETFNANLVPNKNYKFKYEIVGGAVDGSAHDNEVADVRLRGYTSDGTIDNLVSNSWVQTNTSEEYEFTFTTEYAQFAISIRQKSSTIYENLVVKFSIYEV